MFNKILNFSGISKKEEASSPTNISTTSIINNIDDITETSVVEDIDINIEHPFR